MKILNLIQCANLGGMEQASLRLMRGLQDRGHELQLLSLNPIGKLGVLLTEAHIPHEGLPYVGKGGWRMVPVLRRKLWESRADALIMTGHHLLGMFGIGKFCLGRRLLAIHFHHTGVKPSWQWRLIYRIACRRFQTITYPSEFIRQEAERLYAPVATRAYTVRNPLDIPVSISGQERWKARLRLGLPESAPVIGNAGWLIPRKRFDVFLRVAREVLNVEPRAMFLIAGDGSERPRLEAIASELGIVQSLRWLGWQSDMRMFYAALNVLLFNSDWDALGLTPLEAMAHGIPVVSSVVNGGLSEVINSDEVGLLRPAHNVSELASLVIKFIREPEYAAKVGRMARHRVECVSRTEPIVAWHERVLSGEFHSGSMAPAKQELG